MKPTIVFFGSFQHYSTKVLRALVESKSANVLAVVTTPGENATTDYAESQNIPVFSPKSLDQLGQLEIRNLQPDFFVVAGYGKLLPPNWLEIPKVTALNLHFSLLPKYRGANPAEWAILRGEKETGVTLIKMDAGLDTGPILMQQSLPISQPTLQGYSLQGGDTRETLYEKLYDLAGSMIVKFLQTSRFGTLTQIPQPQNSPTPYAKRLTRQDGYIPWSGIQKAIQTGQNADVIERKTRAFYGYPGLWTEVQTTKGQKRMKILSTSIKDNKLILEKVQVEGLAQSTYNQIKNQLQP